MKTVVETTLDYSLSALKSQQSITDVAQEMRFLMTEFNYILNLCLLAASEKQLRNSFKNLCSTHFAWGFGSSHFWVKQRGGAITYPNRLLYIEFQRHTDEDSLSGTLS